MNFPTITPVSISAEVAELHALRAENARLKKAAAEKPKQAAPKITFKVSQRGAISVYGMGKFPVTLYPEQWVKLLGEAGSELLAFISNNLAQIDAATLAWSKLTPEEQKARSVKK